MIVRLILYFHSAILNPNYDRWVNNYLKVPFFTLYNTLLKYSVPVDGESTAVVSSQYIITNDFTTGKFEQTSSRDFDFSIHTIPNTADLTFGIDDKGFTDVKYLSSGSNVVVYTGIWKQECVVVKMLKSKIKNRRVAVEELNLEMQILAKVDHDNIIRINGAGEKPRKFIILEYLGGGTLDRLLEEMTMQEKSLQKGSRIPLTLSFRWQTALPIAMQLASVLKYLHHDFHPRAAIIHRGTYITYIHQPYSLFHQRTRLPYRP